MKILETKQSNGESVIDLEDDYLFCTMKYERDNAKVLKAEIEKFKAELERLSQKYED